MRKLTIKRLLDISIAMAAERDGERLLERIITDAMDITGCDGGTLYIISGETLSFKVMITKSMHILRGGRHGNIDLPPVPLIRSNVCAYSVLESKLVNIPDVYQSDLFDFSGPRNYDALTGYKTTSMMVVPMENNKGQLIGVMQLINAKNSAGEIIPFAKSSEIILLALASQAAISLTNMNYTMEMRKLMESIVETFSTVIYTRTPYNVTHTTNMVKYALRFLDWLAATGNDWKFNKIQRRQLLMTIWLHDVGKLVTPLEIMNKETRLGPKYEKVMTRLEIIALLAKINQLEHGADYQKVLDEIAAVKDLIDEVNTIGYLNDDLLAKVRLLATKTYIDQQGQSQNWFTKDEICDLSIRKGTLTDDERVIMQEHAIITKEILDKIKFQSEYAKVPIWAAQHHEFLNGSGYPNCLSGIDLDPEVRLLTILDIFDGIAALDRPYKKPTPIAKALAILGEMAEDGQIDKHILSLFSESRVWEDDWDIPEGTTIELEDDDFVDF